MVRHRSFWVSSAFSHTPYVFALTLACGLAGCKSSADDSGESGKTPGQANANDCYSCGVEACPSEASKCDDLPVCVTLRDCTLDCAPTDAVCKTDCTAAASKDSNAIVAGANFVACAALNCPDECVGSPTSGPGSGPTSGSPSDPSGSGDLCQQLTDWAAGCNIDVSSQIPDCSALDAAQECAVNCILDASCTAFQDATAGTQNSFTTCMTNCAVGGTPTATPSTPEEPLSTGFSVAAGGYVTSGTWKGFAWTGTDTTSGSTIQPADYTTSLGGGGLCATGTVVGTTDYSAVAMVGISLNQPNMDPAPTPGTWTPPPSSLGIGYQLSNFLGTKLRIQLQAPGGDTDANLRFCAEASTGGTLSWSKFNTKCWDNSGLSYNGTTPLESILVLVPGEMADTSFDFCLQSITPQ